MARFEAQLAPGPTPRGGFFTYEIIDNDAKAMQRCLCHVYGKKSADYVVSVLETAATKEPGKTAISGN